jgi:hypothetical protein
LRGDQEVYDQIRLRKAHTGFLIEYVISQVLYSCPVSIRLSNSKIKCTMSKIIVSAFADRRKHLFPELLLLLRELYSGLERYLVDPCASRITARLQNVRD